MQRSWRVFDCFVPVLGAVLLVGGCGPDGDGGSSGFDARPASDAASTSIDAAVNDAAIDDASVNDAATDDAATDDADLADANTTDAGPAAGVVLNEVLLDQLGTDSNEFAELKGEPNTDYSALTLLQVDGDAGGNPGLILMTTHSGCTTDADGYCEIQVVANTFQNGTQTLLLVTGAGPFSLVDIDADDDGVVDNAVWDQLVDAVAIFDNKPSTGNVDRTYSGNAVLTKVIDGAEQPVAFGGASRIPDGTDTDEAADWTSNTPDFTNAGIQSGEANNTPGAVNTAAP